MEALSGGVKRKFAFQYGLKQWIVNNLETRKKKQKQQKPVKTQTATDAVMECPLDDKPLHALFEIVTNRFPNVDSPTFGKSINALLQSLTSQGKLTAGQHYKIARKRRTFFPQKVT